MRYDSWRELALECQLSGVSVQAWCKEKNIPGTTCRQWLSRLKKEKEYPLLKEGSNQDVDLPVWEKVDFKESNQKEVFDSSPSCKNNIYLKYHDWSIELSTSFDPNLLKQIMKVLESVC